MEDHPGGSHGVHGDVHTSPWLGVQVQQMAEWNSRREEENASPCLRLRRLGQGAACQSRRAQREGEVHGTLSS